MKLDLVWSANFSDGKVIHQFEDPIQQTREHKFQEVLDRFDTLTEFYLHNIKSGKDYKVDLKTGALHLFQAMLPCVPGPEVEVAGNPNMDYRLIYFRRVTRHMQYGPGSTNKLQEVGEPEVAYFLGVQYNDEAGKNIKRLLQISKYDEVYFN